MIFIEVISGPLGDSPVSHSSIFGVVLLLQGIPLAGDGANAPAGLGKSAGRPGRSGGNDSRHSLRSRCPILLCLSSSFGALLPLLSRLRSPTGFKVQGLRKKDPGALEGLPILWYYSKSTGFKGSRGPGFKGKRSSIILTAWFNQSCLLYVKR